MTNLERDPPSSRKGVGKFVPYKIGDEPFALEQIAEMYPTPFLALKEYVNNPIDRRLPGIPLSVEIIVDVAEHQITLRDNSSGIPYDFLEKIPESIAVSQFRGQLDVLSGKGFGMLAALGTLEASGVRVYTRPRDIDPAETYYMAMRPIQQKGAEVRPIHRNYSPFQHQEDYGTVIFLEGLDSELLLQSFKPEMLAPQFAELYDPLLRKDIVKIGISIAEKGEVKQDSLREVLPLEFPGDRFYYELHEIGADKDNRQRTIEVLLFADPNPENAEGKIALYRSGMRVYPSITALPQFRTEAWRSGRVSGWVNANYLRLTAPRTDVQQDTRAFRKFLSDMRTINLEGKIKEKIAELEQQEPEERLKREIETARRALDVVMESYRRLELKIEKTLELQKPQISLPPLLDERKKVEEKSEEGKKKPDIPVPVDELPISIEDLLAKARQIEEQEVEEEEAQAESPEESPTGQETPVERKPEQPRIKRRPRRRRESIIIGESQEPVYSVLPSDHFLGNESNLRSKYDDDLGRILINRTHRDYQTVFKQNNNFKKQLRYLTELICGELGKMEARGVLRARLITPEAALNLAFQIAQDLYHDTIPRLR
ncbi:ATP-binding protein [Candidatus Woesearchaeota archaeon]|nr:ATP-binding protein [Candidatus Woesearchaeota archaeon]